MLVASNSPVKCFSDSEISRSLTEVALQAQSLSISRCESPEIRPFYRKLSSRKRGNSLSIFYRISLKYSNYQRG